MVSLVYYAPTMGIKGDTCLLILTSVHTSCSWFSLDTAVRPSQTLNGGLPKRALIFIVKMYTVQTAVADLIENNRDPGNSAMF